MNQPGPVDHSQMVAFPGHANDVRILPAFLLVNPFHHGGHFRFGQKMASVGLAFFSMFPVNDGVFHIKKNFVNPPTEVDGKKWIVCTLDHIYWRVAKIHQEMHVPGGDASGDGDQASEPVRIKHADHVGTDGAIGQPGKKNPVRIQIVLFAELVNETEHHFFGVPCPPSPHRISRT